MNLPQSKWETLTDTTPPTRPESKRSRPSELNWRS